MENSYSNRYFKSQHDRDSIWRKFMSADDVYKAIDRLRGSIAHMSKHQPHKLNREDMEFMEIPLAELEVAMRKVKNIPKLFNLSEEQLKEIQDAYTELRAKVEKINLQRISWN